MIKPPKKNINDIFKEVYKDYDWKSLFIETNMQVRKIEELKKDKALIEHIKMIGGIPSDWVLRSIENLNNRAAYGVGFKPPKKSNIENNHIIMPYYSIEQYYQAKAQDNLNAIKKDIKDIIDGD